MEAVLEREFILSREMDSHLSPVGCMSTLVLLTAVGEGVRWSEGV